MQFLLYQEVGIPANVTRVVLSWKDRVQWDFFVGNQSQQRTYAVQVRDPVSNACYKPFTCSIPASRTAWATLVGKVIPPMFQPSSDKPFESGSKKPSPNHLRKRLKIDSGAAAEGE